MGAFVLSLDIARQVQDVYSFLADIENTPTWYAAVKEVRKLTPGPVARGSVYRLVRQLPTGVVENEVEVSELVLNQRVTIQSRSGPTPFRYRYSLEPAGSGTRLALAGEITGEGLKGAAALLAPLAGQLFKRGMASNLKALKAHLEGRDLP